MRKGLALLVQRVQRCSPVTVWSTQPARLRQTCFCWQGHTTGWGGVCFVQPHFLPSFLTAASVGLTCGWRGTAVMPVAFSLRIHHFFPRLLQFPSIALTFSGVLGKTNRMSWKRRALKQVVVLDRYLQLSLLVERFEGMDQGLYL